MSSEWVWDLFNMNSYARSVNTGSGNGLLTKNTKPLSEPMLTQKVNNMIIVVTLTALSCVVPYDFCFFYHTFMFEYNSFKGRQPSPKNIVAPRQILIFVSIKYSPQHPRLISSLNELKYMNK